MKTFLFDLMDLMGIELNLDRCIVIFLFDLI